MAKVRVVRHVRISGRRVPVKRVPNLVPILEDSRVEATAIQLRVLAEESRDIILDKLFAGRPQAPGEVILSQPRRLRQPQELGRDRAPFDHPPLTRKHARLKAREGLDGRTLLMTGDYVENGIEVFKGEQQSGVYYMVRPAVGKHEGFDPKSGPITYRRLAMVHEFGSAKHRIPPRPHWRPAAEAIIARFERTRRTVRALQLRSMLRRIG